MASVALHPGLATGKHTSAPRVIAVLGLRNRADVEDLIEQLIAWCDKVDGDPDLEEDNVDCCEAYDDRPGECVSSGLGGPGNDDDAEGDAPAMEMTGRYLPGYLADARTWLNSR